MPNNAFDYDKFTLHQVLLIRTDSLCLEIVMMKFQFQS